MYSCELCDDTFETEEELEEQLKKEHSEEIDN